MPLRLPLLLAIAVLLLGGVVPLRTHAAVPPEACARIDAAARGVPGRLAYVLVDLDAGGGGCAARADEEFAAASLARLFVVAAAYQERERGTLPFEEPLTIGGDGAADPGAPRAPLVAVSGAVRLTVQAADAPAALALRERLGGDVVAAMPVRLGLRDTHLGEQQTTTAGDIGRFFALLHAGRVVSSAASTELLEAPRGDTPAEGLTRGLPAGTPFAHLASADGRLAHDGGIVGAARGSYALVVLSDGEPQAARAAMEAIASAAFSAYSGQSLPRSGSFGDPNGPARPASDASGLGWPALLGLGAVALAGGHCARRGCPAVGGAGTGGVDGFRGGPDAPGTASRSQSRAHNS